MIDFLLGAAVASGLWFAYVHFTRSPAVPGVSNGLVDSLLTTFRTVTGEFVEAIKAEIAKLPAQISAEVASLKELAASWQQRAETAEANLAQEIAARGAILTSVQQQLQATIATGLAPGAGAAPPAAAPAAAAPAVAEEDD